MAAPCACASVLQIRLDILEDLYVNILLTPNYSEINRACAWNELVRLRDMQHYDACEHGFTYIEHEPLEVDADVNTTASSGDEIIVT